MASLANTKWFIDSVAYTAVTSWVANTAKTVGLFIRATAPTVGNERVFVCIVAGTTANPTQPTWAITKGAKTTDGTVTWQECTGQAGVNGDTTDAPSWAASSPTVLGQVIKNTGATGMFICSTSSGNTGGSQPAGLTTPVLGATTTDGSNVWTCIKASLPFGSWAAPFARWQSAVTANWGADGDTFYIGDNHAATQTNSSSCRLLGTPTAPSLFLCVDHTKLPPYAAGDLKTTATETSSTGSMNVQSLNSVSGVCYVYGVTFAGGGVSPAGLAVRFDNCGFNANQSGTAVVFGVFQGSSSGASIECYNPTITHSNAGNSMQFNGGLIRIIGGSQAGTAPTNAVTNTAAQNHSNVIFDGFDVSNMASSATLVTALALPHQIQWVNCKTPASWVLATAPTYPHNARVQSISTSNTTTVVDTRVNTYEGAMTTDTGVIVTASGATDGNTPYSWKIVTTAGTNAFWAPFETPLIAQLNAIGGAFRTGASITAKVEIASATAGLTNADVWLEAEYMGSGSTPISTRLSSGVATILTAGSALPAGVPWTSSPGNTYELSLAITSPDISLNGVVRFVVKVGKPSITVYVDPKVTLS